MNRNLFAWASLAAALIALTACTDRADDSRREAAKQFEQILTRLQQAQTGPAPSQLKDADLVAALQARCAALNAAATQLAAVTPQLAPAQQVEARRVRAVVVATAQAGLDRFQALQAWGDLAPDLSRLAVRLDALAQARAGAHALDADDATARARINDDLAAAEKELQAAQADKDAVAKEAADLQTQGQAQTAAREAARTEAAKLHAQALEAAGARQNDLNGQALDADFRVQKADSEVTRINSVAAVTAGRLSIADLALAKAGDKIGVAKQQLAQRDQQAQADAAQRQAILGTGASPAATSVSALAAEFVQAFDSADSRFKQNLESHLDAAAQALAGADAAAPSATTLLAQALQQAGPDDKRAVQSDLLQIQTAYVDLLARRGAILAVYSRALAGLAQRAAALAPEAAPRIQAAASRVKEQQAQLDTTARKAAAEALTLADELSKDSNKALADSARSARALIEQLQAPSTATP
jgi:hypothetical protein